MPGRRYQADKEASSKKETCFWPREGKNRVQKRLFVNISKLVENQRRNMFDQNKPLGTPQKPVETPGANSPPSPRYGPNKGQKGL